jgi:branched-chain amino acid transport system substrate-binding protein
MESKKKDSYVPTDKTDIQKDNSASSINDGLSRRQAISRMGWAGVGIVAVVVVGVGGYLAYKAATPGTSSTTTTTAPPTTTAAAGTVLMGAVLSLSGPMAGFGQGQTYGHKAAIADVNALGGIDIGGKKYTVQYKAYDDTSDSTKAATLAEQLILQDKVDILIHGNGPPVTTIPICTTAERYKVPFIMGSPFEPWSAGAPSGGWKYSWSILFRIGMPPTGFAPGYTIADNYTGLTNKYKDQLDNTNVAILAAGDSDGTGWYQAFPGILQKAGYQTPDPELYPTGTTDFSSVITKWKNDKCEVVWANLPPPDFGTFWRQSKELGYRPKLAIIGRAPLFYQDVSSWGSDLPLGVVTECWWDPTWSFQGFTGTTSQTLAQRWITDTGTPLNRNIAFGYAAVQIAADSMNRAGTTDKTAVNTAIGQTNGNFMNGPCKFFPDTHDSPCVVTLAQWQPVSTSAAWSEVIVYSIIPQYPAPGTPIFPLPAWSA